MWTSGTATQTKLYVLSSKTSVRVNPRACVRATLSHKLYTPRRKRRLQPTLYRALNAAESCASFGLSTMLDPFAAKLASFHRAHTAFEMERNSSRFFHVDHLSKDYAAKQASMLATPLHFYGHANHWGQNVLDLWEPEYSCDHEVRVPEVLGDGPKWMCGAALHPEPCTLVSLGSSFDARFEQAMHRLANCSAYIVDPTLASGNRARARLPEFTRQVEAFGAVLNTSVGVGRNGATVKLMREHTYTRLVGLRELLRDRFPGVHRHISILKVDVEGAEYDALADAYQMCADGELSIDQMTVEFHVGLAIQSGDARNYTLRHLRDVFAGASACGLMLHHKERNSWGCDGYACIEYSWVSATHARRTFMSLRASLPESHRRISVRS